MTPRWHVLAGPMLSVVAICLTFGAFEAAFRVYHKLRYDVPLAPAPAGLSRYIEEGYGTRLSPIMLDDELGWRATPSYAFDGLRRNGDGSTYPVQVSFDSRGFRLFGDPESGRPRILVIGDSFTQAVEVSDGKGYYALLREALEAELFVYGVGGYGTLQELLALDRHLDRIRPDLVLWQYCSNDFIANVPELERASVFGNNGLVRPYWVDGRVEHALPKADPLGIRAFAVRYSRLAHWALGRWDLLRAGLPSARTATVEYGIERQGPEHEGFAQAAEVTSSIMAEARRRTGDVPIVAFSCDDRWPYHDALGDVSARNGIAFVAEVARSIDGAAQAGAVVKVEDGHWNEAGHRLAAEALLVYLRDATALQAAPVGQQ